ncbi:Hypothetical protein ACI5QM_00374 [Bacillus subtilis]
MYTKGMDGCLKASMKGRGDEKKELSKDECQTCMDRLVKVKVQQIRHSSMPIPEEMVKRHETDKI